MHSPLGLQALQEVYTAKCGTSLISGRGGVAVGVNLPQLGAGCLFAPPYVYAYL